ncbi:MAG: SH3 domain-containing protein [Alishewanella sp.]|nr:SH3 domain-containing protein [Alishewanella sp.]
MRGFLALRYAFAGGLLLLISGLSSAATEHFTSDIPLLKVEHLSPEYWLAKQPNAAELLLTPSQIAQRNAQTFAQQAEMTPIADIPLQFSQAELLKVIEQVSAIPQSPRFFADGKPLQESDWAPIQQQVNRAGVAENTSTQFALVTKRSALLAMPTTLRVFNDSMSLDLNRLQETALFVGEPVAVLHQSADGHWSLVQNYHYSGWVATEALALAPRQQVLAYAEQAPFLVVTGARAFSNYVPNQPQISELQLDMGTRLPLLSAAAVGHNLYGQNPHASYIVQLPTRNAKGQLQLVPALLARNQDVHIGYLPYSTEHIVRQAFKYLGQRYGWGYDYNGVDCTGFLVDIFRTFGLLMPRNSGQQGYGEFGQNVRFTEQSSHNTKLQAIKQAQIGDFIYRPGHVMLYLGESAGEPFVIHAVFDLAYVNAAGEFYRGTLNSVSVTPLAPLYLSAEQSYLDRIYAIKSLR